MIKYSEIETAYKMITVQIDWWMLKMYIVSFNMKEKKVYKTWDREGKESREFSNSCIETRNSETKKQT